MASQTSTSGEYVLATGPAAVRRLRALHAIYAPMGRRTLLEAGLKPGMKVADLGCGVGMVTNMLSEMVGPEGHVTGVDLNSPQLVEACENCAKSGLNNTAFVEASACQTGLPRNSFDLVYCRFLLLHLTDPADCLREMFEILKPGGILVVEDGDLATVTSVPPGPTDQFATLFAKLGEARGLNYSLCHHVYHMVLKTGFKVTNVDIHQPVLFDSETRMLPTWSIQECGPALAKEGILTEDEHRQVIEDMRGAAEDPNCLMLGVLMYIVSARKP